ncbi:MAG: hypothetical protein R2824_25710 [Saprospiraceae bacterium]|nr:hypothetical protein [Lewinella sp.]
MKTFSSLLFTALLALLFCSFTGGPVGNNSNPAAEKISVDDLSFGGAYLVFGKKYGGEITKKQFAGQRQLGVDGCAAGSRIFTYQLQITHAGKTAYYSAESNMLSEDMVAKLKSLVQGDTFQFKKIQAYLPNGKDVVDVHSREFVVV